MNGAAPASVRADGPRRTVSTVATAADLPPARVLVVDDQRVHRDKLVHAVRALGHDAESVDGGARALARLAERPFDLVLLDILMPDMDGFEVMNVMRRDRRLTEIPVIVVSALESEMDSVVRAVEMGAEDVLPKRFDRVLLAARLDSALERRRARAREHELHRHMRRLTDAAAVLEHDPGLRTTPPLAETCRRDDAIGRLARVFVHMSGEVHARDERLRRQLALLRLSGLALGAGAVLGFAPPLARVVLVHEPHPFGLALWLAALCTLFCLPVVLWRGRLPRREAGLGRLVATLALTAGLMGTLPLLWLARELPVGAFVAVLPVEIALALVLAPLLDGRRASASRLLALALALAATIVLARGAVTGTGGAVAWRPDLLALASLVPLGWALSGRALARRTAGAAPVGIDAPALVGLVAFVTACLIAPVAIVLDDLIPLFRMPIVASGIDTSSAVVAADGIGIGLVVVLLGTVIAAGATLRVLLAREGGAESAAASSLWTALAALGWSAMVLDERAPLGLWVPFALFAATLPVRWIAIHRSTSRPPPRLDVELA